MSVTTKSVIPKPAVFVAGSLIIVLFIVNMFMQREINSAVEMPPASRIDVKVVTDVNSSKPALPGSSEQPSIRVEFSNQKSGASPYPEGTEIIYEPSIKDKILLQ